MTRCKNGVIGRRTDRRGMPTGEAPATPNRKVASATLRCLTTDLLSGNRSCSIISVLESTITKSASRGSNGIFVHQDYRTTRVRIRHRAESAYLLSNRAGRTPCSGRVRVDCDHGVEHTFSGHLAGEEIVQSGQNLLRESDVVRLSFGQRRGFCDIQNHTGNHCHGSHCPT